MIISDYIKKFPWIKNIIYTIVVIILGIIIYHLIYNILFKRIEKRSGDIFKSTKSNTFIKLFKSIYRYLYIIILVFILLKVNGVNITSMVTGVGVIGIIFGFAIQDALKDIIKGVDIITDSYYQVGDIVKIDKYTGKVISIGIKTTKLEDIYEGNIVSISNRNIEKVEVISHLININIPLPYELKLKDAERIINKIIKDIQKLSNVEKAEYRGVNDFADSSIKYYIKVYCPPINKLQTRRDCLACILKHLEDNSISIPYNQIDVHQKK